MTLRGRGRKPKPPVPDAPEAPPAPGAVQVVAAGLANRLRDGLISALIPLISLLVTPIAATVRTEAEARPWQTLWVTLPAAVALWIALQLRRDQRPFRPGGKSLWVLVIAGAVVMSAAFLRAQLRPSCYAGVPAGESLQQRVTWPRGDWRYRLIRRPPREPRITVVLLPAQGLLERRRSLAMVLQRAIDAGALGVAMDVYFAGPDTTFADMGLVMYVSRARAMGMPVLAGLPIGFSGECPAVEVLQGAVSPRLAAVFPDSTLGHLAAYREADQLFRALPLFLEDHPGQPAWSLRVARCLAAGGAGSLRQPANRVLRFVPPAREFPTVALDSLMLAPVRHLDYLRRQFVLIGEDSPRDRFTTPFGEQPGVVIHAWAVNSLLTGRFVQKDRWWAAILVVWPLLYVLAALWSRGASRRRLLLWSGGFVLGCCALVAAAMIVGCFWLDFFSVLPPILLFPPVLMLVGRR